jgi:hypothetical protein
MRIDTFCTDLLQKAGGFKVLHCSFLPSPLRDWSVVYSRCEELKCKEIYDDN